MLAVEARLRKTGLMFRRLPAGRSARLGDQWGSLEMVQLRVGVPCGTPLLAVAWGSMEGIPRGLGTRPVTCDGRAVWSPARCMSVSSPGHWRVVTSSSLGDRVARFGGVRGSGLWRVRYKS